LLILAVSSRGYTPACLEDICTNGFCGVEVGEAVCSCALGWTGDTCEVEDDAYDALECVNGFVGIVDENFVCSCNSGWEGDSCSEKIIDYDPCSDVECNNQGHCTLSSELEPYCDCFEGYSGQLCEHEDTMCGEEYLLNVASTVYDESWNAGLDCTFFIGLLWSDMTINNITGYPSLCTCLDMITVNMTYWSINFGCVIWENFALSLWAMNNLHCNHCTDDEILDMKAAIQNYSESCDMFISHREEMPLYWRTPLKCVCLESLGDTRDEVAEWVYCPFTAHPARTDLTAYDNCNDESIEICDFTYLKQEMELNMKARNPSGLEICTSAFIDLMEMLPTDISSNTYLPDDWCPCYEAIAEYWSDGLDVLDCLAVTFYEFTIKDLYFLFCNDELFINRDELVDVGMVSIVASSYDYRIAATCQNFMVYGSALTDVATDASLLRANTLFCNCMEGLEEVVQSEGSSVSGMVINWDTFTPDQIADGVLYMLGLLELFPNALADLSVNDCEFVTEDSIFVSDIFLGSKSAAKKTFRFDTKIEGETNAVDYTMLNICLALLCAVLTLSNVLIFQIYSDERNKMPSFMVL